MPTRESTACRARHGAVRLACAVAVVLCLLSGGGSRYIAAALRRDAGGTVLPAGVLEAVPLQFGACQDATAPAPCWNGEVLTFDDDRVRRMDSDAYIYRVYTSSDGLADSLKLLVTAGRRPRDLQPHRPEVCYPAAGWSLREDRDEHLLTPQGTALTGRLQRFVRGGLSLDQVWVFSYYIADADYAADMAAIRARMWRPDHTVEHLTMVQIIVPAHRRLEEAAQRARSFAALSAESIRETLAGCATGDGMEQAMDVESGT